MPYRNRVMFVSQVMLASTGMLVASAVQAQVVLDGTLGQAGPLPGPDYAITAGLGRQVGGNLFHSFGQFSIRTGESATFSGPNSVSNIISRVTGGQISLIDGALRSTIPGANLYLLNPAGVLFGENARLDVSGSFHASTADYLRLSDGGRFDARVPANSVLTVAPVEAFGFLGDTPGRITVEGAFLRVPEGQTLSLIGGDIALTNAAVYAPAGRINVASVASAGEVIPTATDLSLRGFGGLGTLTLEQDGTAERPTANVETLWGNFDLPLADLDASGAGGGAIFIRSGQWVSRGGWVFADTYGARAGHGIQVAIAGAVRFDEGALLTADTYGTRAGGAINLVADTLSVLNGSQIHAYTFDTGNANAGGGVALAITNTVSVLNGGIISASTFGSGDAGDLTVTARNLLVDGQGAASFTGISSDTLGNGAGGRVILAVTDAASILNGSAIRANTFGGGNAGDVTITTRNLLVDGQGAASFTGIASNAEPRSTGPGGNVTLAVTDTLSILDGGAISAATFGAKDAGDLTITARNLLVDRRGNSLFTGIASDTLGTGAGGGATLAVADTLSVLNGGAIRANTFGGGDAGDLTVTAGNLLVDGQGTTFFTGIASNAEPGSTGAGGRITLAVADTLSILDGGVISAATFGAKDAGDLTITARNLLVDRQGTTFFTGIASSAEFGSTGGGGGVTLTVADTLSVLNGGAIRANTFGGGDAGDVTVITGNLLVDGQGSTFFTGIASNAEPGSTGAGGGVTLTVADTLTVLEGGAISAATFGAKDAGDLTITARNLLVDGQKTAFFTGIASSAEPGSIGAGGSVTLAVADTLSVLNSGTIRAATWGAGNAGDITVTARNLLVDDGGMFSSAEPGATGAGGDLTLNLADTLSVLNGGQISATTFGPGDAGDIILDVGRLSLSGGSAISVGTGGYRATTLFGGRGQGGNLTVDAAESVSISGDGSGLFASTLAPATGRAGAIQVRTPHLTLEDGGTIQSATSGDGDAGDITLNVGRLSVTGVGGISTQTGLWSETGWTGGLGGGGDISITATEAVYVAGPGSTIGADSFAPATGAAGTIRLTAPVLELTDAGAITSATSGDGAGGDILLNGGRLSLSGGSEISSGTTGGRGHGGNLLINAADAVSIAGSRLGVSSRAPATGHAGNLTLTTPRLTLTGGGILAESDLTTGGNILVNADHLWLFDGSAISSSVEGDAFSDGGNVTLNSINIIAMDSTITARANQGRGGVITINADVFLHNPVDVNEVLNASSRVAGNDGTIQNNAPTTDLSGSLVGLNLSYLDAAGQLTDRCAEGDRDSRSRFTVQGRGALPPSPDEPVAAAVSGCHPSRLAATTPAARPPADRSGRPVPGFGDR